MRKKLHLSCLTGFWIHLCTNYFHKTISYQGRIQRFWKGVALYFGHYGWPTKKILAFRWSKKANITLDRKYKFLANYFYQHFQIFSIFIYNESLPMKYYKIFKICKRSDKDREKTHMQQSMEKENWKKLDFVLSVKYTPLLNEFKQLSDPIIWTWTAVYTYEINWKNAKKFCEYASEIFALYLWRSMEFTPWKESIKLQFEGLKSH